MRCIRDDDSPIREFDLIARTAEHDIRRCHHLRRLPIGAEQPIPYRDITQPLLDEVRSIGRSSPRDVVIVFVPEYVVRHWWEALLHNQSALRLKARLLFQPGVMVTSVPWQMRWDARRS